MSVRKYTFSPRSWAYSHIGPNASRIASARATWSSSGPYTSSPSPMPSNVRYSMKPGIAIAVYPSASTCCTYASKSARATSSAASSM